MVCARLAQRLGELREDLVLVEGAVGGEAQLVVGADPVAERGAPDYQGLGSGLGLELMLGLM